MKKVLVITGTRADYGIYYPILKAMESDIEINLQLLVTGMHLSPQYGHTIEYILQDGFEIVAQVDCILQNSTHANMAKGLGLAILGMTQAFETINPDCILILGDRSEMLAAASVAAYMNIPIFHLHGGEVSGTIDDSVRHAISKLAHIHLAATENSSERLLRMGEEEWRVHIVGAPRIETIRNTLLLNKDEVKVKYQLHSDNSYFLFIYHPVTTEQMNLEQIKQILNLLLDQQNDVICVMPNADAGSDQIIELYQTFTTRTNFYPVTSFEQTDYLAILKEAVALVGNSSSGIIEAASFQIPVINIGSRQEGRERSENVIDIDENVKQLAQALEYINMNDFRNKLSTISNVYEQPNTSKHIIELLKRFNKSDNLIQKRITF
ncbi:UDP-N-acetylglucosamine 2-epimerase [Paenibacillus hunanensis]|uniref:UDP-N-acetylglucosamine 2-epimerase n=1 Tax=Paenibacillus hunanensis TaxID=539262 RepID=UPI002026263A|nr:UDP-N-acetylglucosamine 2-epimerase [Paenibacillus hunanensis]MCL9662788.1 UDP-N-acetylglucosamine 2-epimerase [Paenibacillus hunanensis]